MHFYIVLVLSQFYVPLFGNRYNYNHTWNILFVAPRIKIYSKINLLYVGAEFETEYDVSAWINARSSL